MTAIKISRFLGIAPKISPELLPDTAAQIAHNCKLFSGDLIPYTQPKVIGSVGHSGIVKTLYGLRNPDTHELVWQAWSTNVSVAIASSSNKDEQRFYYTGDGSPKVSNYKIATGGAYPYSVNYYELGLPLPKQKLIPVALSYSPKAIVQFSRDASNNATIVTSSPHNLRTGNYITVSGFTYISGIYSQIDKIIQVQINSHGLSNGAQVFLNFTSGTAVNGNYVVSNVIDSNTFEVIAPTSASTTGNVQLDLRSFNAVSVECTVINDTTLSYFSPGPAMNPNWATSATVELGGQKQARSYVYTWYTPWGEESIASEPSEPLYIKDGATVLVGGIPFIPPTSTINFVRGVRLYRTVPSASGTEYYRLATLWFPTPLAAVSRTSNVARIKTKYPHNLSIDDRIKISGCSNPSFDVADVIVANIVDEYTFEFSQSGSDVSESPVTAGMLYYDVAETTDKPARYWGDGGGYTFTDDFDSRNLFDILETDEYDPPPKELQGLTAIQNNVLVGFVGNRLYFSEPNHPHAWPRKYAVTLEHNIVGLAAISGALFVATDAYPYVVSVTDPAAGASISRLDALLPCVSSRSIVVMDYGVVYATHDGLAVYSPSSGPSVITKVLYNKDTWNQDIDPKSIVATYYGDAYFASHSAGSFTFQYDPKIGGYFVTHDNKFTVLRYDSITGNLYCVNDASNSLLLWDASDQPFLVQKWKSKVFVLQKPTNLGAAKVVADWGDGGSVVFRLWADKQLVFEATITDDKIFRLPTGYRTDTFEVGVEGSVRVRAIHLAETPSGLKGV